MNDAAQHNASPIELPYPDVHADWSAITAVPKIDPEAWIAASAVVYGRVSLGRGASVWHQCVLRGDHERIEVGEDSNVQDGSILHVDPGQPCVIGQRVTIGHRAVVHGCVVDDEALIGIGALVLSRSHIGRGALIAAGAVVLEGTVVPPHTLWVGTPARQVRELTPEQRARLSRTWQHYANNSLLHREAERQRRASS